ncbi:hypothetical protein VAE151_560741 [Vibrio aestuarianus]|uniref:Uncharacterized protein n=1 Tax=Vibrio aestuarianus TaxID=28171 RepID=A0ABM9FTL8_9VIBR|nr:hypothetical protein VAE308_1051386 [Vibrio aestuarianus]CAH8209794.1 hypothetical protein VAE055_380735 [Vibrio aestuarianus]CAH8209796.1 hypothetical protein VAE032_271381 [Vibrio aestuarianus]CAH8209898.1 hypothetical protein VAE128_461386 [Vibrio aestuarianus]CAH8210124.1 hypothetical protein VAE130_571382 [Vibrio aestuarianus]
MITLCDFNLLDVPLNPPFFNPTLEINEIKNADQVICALKVITLN